MSDTEKKEIEKGIDPIPQIVKSLMDLCEQVFTDLYGKNTNSFIAAAFPKAEKFYMAGKPLSGTSVRNNNIKKLNELDD